MVKLTAAKCPSCGASIEVNKKLEKVICQYCGDTIFIEDAIAKIKVEHSGNVKVSSVKDSTDKIEIARKYIKVGKNSSAKDIINDILEDNPFDLEALVLQNDLLLQDIERDLKLPGEGTNVDNIDEYEKYMIEFENGDKKKYYYKYVSSAKNALLQVKDNKISIVKTDSNNEYKEYIAELNKEIYKYESIITEETKKKEEKDKIVSELRERIKAYIFSNVGGKYAEVIKRLKRLTKKFGMNDFSGKWPSNLSFFGLGEINEYEIILTELSSFSGCFSSDEPRDLKGMIAIVDEECKKKTIIEYIVKGITAIPALLLLFTGHWILAIIVECLVLSALAELFCM